MQSRLLSVVVTALCFSTAVQATCSHDNCLRALIRSSDAAGSFCTTYVPGPTGALASSTLKPTETASPTPDFFSACSSDIARISSACRCWASTAVATSTSSTSSSESEATPTGSSGCKANSNWPGWEKIKYAFVFGDSYTTTGFNATGIQPTPTNPLGNPTYPGWTSANGPNWVDFLTVKYNQSILLTYNIAYGGATIDSALVAPYLPVVSSVAEQIENEWFPNYASKPPSAPWSSDNSLFAIFDGINDVGNTWYKGLEVTTSLYAEIFAVYHGIVDELYYAGARNFLFLDVPPVDRAPLTLSQSKAAQAEEKDAILAWNELLFKMAKDLKSEHADVNVFTVSTWNLFTQVLDNPAVYPATAEYQNTTAYCEAYQNGTPERTTFNAACGVQVDHYFWLNSLHPTYPMHDVLAHQAADQLMLGPNIC